MGIILGDITKKIKPEHLYHFQHLLNLIAAHQNAAHELAQQIAAIETTRETLNVYRQQRSKDGQDVSLHIVLQHETDRQRMEVYQAQNYHLNLVALFETELNRFLCDAYRIHPKQVAEWHIDVQDMLLYRKPANGDIQPMRESTPRPSIPVAQASVVSEPVEEHESNES